MSRYLVLGTGMMGIHIAEDLAEENAVTLADLDPDKKKVARELGLSFQQIDVTDHQALVKLMQEYDLAISAVQKPQHHYLGLKAAIEAGCHFTDLGADPTTLKKQFALHEEAKNAGITAIPDTGASPGTTNILIGYGTSKLDKTDYIRYYVGAVPLNPTNPPLNYTLLFSVSVLVNEYFEDSDIIEDGKIKNVKGLSGLEEITFPEFGRMEAAFVAGQTSTLTKTFAGKVRELYEKTVRYPGHYQAIKDLAEDFTDRKELEEYLLSILPTEEKDAFLMKVIVWGEKDNLKKEITYSIIHKNEGRTDTTATAEFTAWPASIVAQMIGEGRITKRGVLEQELYVPHREFIDELAIRGIKIKEEVS